MPRPEGGLNVSIRVSQRAPAVGKKLAHLNADKGYKVVEFDVVRANRAYYLIQHKYSHGYGCFLHFAVRPKIDVSENILSVAISS